MKIPFLAGASLTLLLLFAPAEVATAQRIPAVAALNRIAAKHGDRFVSRIVSMRGTYGQSQPEEWEIVVHDASSPYLLREFWVGDTRATDEGANYDYYPKQTPPGFIPFRNIRLDSIDAFDLLVIEAKRAKVGFDSVNYFLRCREFSNEPIWTLQAVDADGNIVGIVDLSAETAKILRMVWINPRATGTASDPKVTDTDLTGSPRSQVIVEPKIDPDNPLVEPAPPRTIVDPAPPTIPAEPDVDGEVPEVIPLPDDSQIVKPRN